MTEETETPNCGRTWKRCVALSSQKKKVLPLLVFIAPSFQLCQSLPSDTGQEWNEKIDDIVEDGLGMPDDDLMEIPNTLDEQEDEEAEAEEAADQDEDHLDRYQETATGEYAAHPLTPQQGSPFASNDFELESDYTSFAPSDQIGCGNDGTSSLDESTFSTSMNESSFNTSNIGYESIRVLIEYNNVVLVGVQHDLSTHVFIPAMAAIFGIYILLKTAIRMVLVATGSAPAEWRSGDFP